MPDCPAADGSSPRQTSFDGPFDMCLDLSKRYTATMNTSMGEIVIALNTAQAPNTVNNFVSLARYHYYDGLVFHRIIQGFMCQGGCPEGSGRGGPGYRFADELPKSGQYELGSLAMANAGPDTNGSQFFIISGPVWCEPATAVCALWPGREGHGCRGPNGEGSHRRRRPPQHSPSHQQRRNHRTRRLTADRPQKSCQDPHVEGLHTQCRFDCGLHTQ